jgi:hypothetical protein
MDVQTEGLMGNGNEVPDNANGERTGRFKVRLELIKGNIQKKGMAGYLRADGDFESAMPFYLEALTDCQTIKDEANPSTDSYIISRANTLEGIAKKLTLSNLSDIVNKLIISADYDKALEYCRECRSAANDADFIKKVNALERTAMGAKIDNMPSVNGVSNGAGKAGNNAKNPFAFDKDAFLAGGIRHMRMPKNVQPAAAIKDAGHLLLARNAR